MGSSRRPAERGFTLIELMIVIAIIGIIAAIAIPNLIESRKAANEASAIQTLRAIHAAQVLFKERDMGQNGEYADTGGALVASRLISASVLDVSHQGYTFGILSSDQGLDMRFEFAAVGAPVKKGSSGDRAFFVDDTGVIRFSTTFNPGGMIVPPASVFRTWPAIGG